MRFVDKDKTHLMRDLSAFLIVTRQTTAHDIVPRRFSPSRHWDHMIDIELGFFEFSLTILTGIFIAQKNILPREFHIASGKFFIKI